MRAAIAPEFLARYTRAMRTPGSAERLEQNRLIAANLFEQKQSCSMVAKAIGAHVQSVRRWRRVFNAGGREALLAVKHKGRPPRLSLQQKQLIYQWLEKTPQECGFDKHLWTQQLIADLIKRELKVDYHHDHVGFILDQLDITYQKPKRVAIERDEQNIQLWRQQTWPELLKKAKRPMA